MSREQGTTRRRGGTAETPSVVGPVIACLLMGAALVVGLEHTADGATGPRAAAVSATSAPTCEGRPATIYPGDGTSPPSDGGGWTLIGTDGDDVIVGSDRADRISGRAGDDVICGLRGADEISGDSGDDRLVGSVDKARLRGGPDDDSLQAPAQSRSRLNGGPGDDRVRGGSGADLRVGRGHDRVVVWLVRGPLATVVGGGGRDHGTVRVAKGALSPGATVTVDAYWSKLTAQGAGGWASWRSFEHVRLSGPDIRWIYKGSVMADHVTVGRGASTQMFGGEGPDRFTGGPANDLLVGGPGRDVLDGGKGQDRCVTGEVVRRCELRR